MVYTALFLPPAGLPLIAMWYEVLPHVNAFLNTMCFVLLCCGYVAIRKGHERLHARFMLAAFFTSTLFLISYVTYHFQVLHKPYTGEGWIRTVYLLILGSHIVLAVVILPLVLVTLYFALRERFDRHRKVARWTFPMWVYVSVTGVTVYVMLYVF